MPFPKKVLRVMCIAGIATTCVQPLAAQDLTPSRSGERQAFLVRQDQSDCTNTNISPGDSLDVGGNVVVTRGGDGNTIVHVAMTLAPNTVYHFNLKCVRQLGDIMTGEEGAGFATFVFPTNSVGSTFAFDVYPDGAPPGHTFQSVTVSY